MCLKLSATYKIQTQTPFLNLNLAFKKAAGDVRASSGTLETSTTGISSRHGPRGLPGHCGLRQGRDIELAVMGELPAAIVVAARRAITSAGGYLRELTRKAEAGEFSLRPMLMVLMAKRKREKKRA